VRNEHSSRRLVAELQLDASHSKTDMENCEQLAYTDLEIAYT